MSRENAVRGDGRGENAGSRSTRRRWTSRRKCPAAKRKRHAAGAALREAGQRLVRMRVLVKLGEITDRVTWIWGLPVGIRKMDPPGR